MTARKRVKDPWPAPSETPPVSGIELVSMEMDQLDTIMAIERESFPIPWNREAFEHDISVNELASYWTVLKDGEIIGYSGIWIMDRIAHLTTICLREAFRGIGLGKWLLLETMRRGGELGAERFTLEVRESNEIAVSLYEKVGYRVVGRRHEYYKEIGEDALVMWTGGSTLED